VRLAGRPSLPADGYQGNWIPHQLRPAVGGQRFFVGDSAGTACHWTAEGIRTALYSGLRAPWLRSVLDGHATRADALARYGAFSDSHERKFRWLLNTQRAVGRFTPSRAIHGDGRTMASERLLRVAFKPLSEDRTTIVRGPARCPRAAISVRRTAPTPA